MYPPERWLGEEVEEQELPNPGTVFCLVDVYGLGHHPDDPAPAPSPALCSTSSVAEIERIAVKHIKPALLAARQLRLPIVYLNNSSPRIELMRSSFGRQELLVTDLRIDDLFAEPDADGLEYQRGDDRFVSISKLLAPEPGEYFIRKHVYSGFFETRLDSLLRNLGARWIIFLGFALDACLLATTLDALYRGYEVVVLRDCTLACDKPDEAATLTFTERMITWIEMMVGRTSTSQALIEAAKHLTVTPRGVAQESPPQLSRAAPPSPGGAEGSAG
jgi:nicotinamidase-related amidase